MAVPVVIEPELKSTFFYYPRPEQIVIPQPKNYRIRVQDSGNPNYFQRVLVATPSTGLVRMEWVQARYGQVLPVNWSAAQWIEWCDGYVPMRYQVDDAQNLICRAAIQGNYEWLLMIEHDTCPPPDAFLRFNQYMRDENVPVVSGLYYTRSRPPEPLIFRGRGVGVFTDWKQGDLVMADGVPTGCLLIHMSLIRALWDDSPEYAIRGQVTRRVFDTPRAEWYDPQYHTLNAISGTSDLQWCSRIIAGHFMAKAGWPDFDGIPYPFLVDTNIACIHIDMNGEKYP